MKEIKKETRGAKYLHRAHKSRLPGARSQLVLPSSPLMTGPLEVRNACTGHTNPGSQGRGPIWIRRHPRLGQAP